MPTQEPNVRKSSDIPRRGGKWVPILLVPYLVVLLVVELARLWRTMKGEELLIATWPGSELAAQWPADPWLFILALVLHAVLILLAAGALFLYARQIRQWLRAGRERTGS